MPRFLLIGTYSQHGARVLMAAGGSARRRVLERAVEELGGRLETFDFAFGGEDVYAIFEVPDDHCAAALALTIAAGGVATVRTVVLLTPEQIDRAAQLHPSYTPAPTAG
ncbi:MAG TPA: GYD domain-containing protein [Geodermatophilus sp.]|nr:GYD domain-containing protein [Geodermatophilus sp.]